MIPNHAQHAISFENYKKGWLDDFNCFPFEISLLFEGIFHCKSPRGGGKKRASSSHPSHPSEAGQKIKSSKSGAKKVTLSVCKMWKDMLVAGMLCIVWKRYHCEMVWSIPEHQKYSSNKYSGGTLLWLTPSYSRTRLTDTSILNLCSNVLASSKIKSGFISGINVSLKISQTFAKR